MGQGYFIDYTKISFVIFFYALKKRFYSPFSIQKQRLKAKEKEKDSDFMNVLLAFKNSKII